ncbi:MAG: beta-1,6-N-acetylglucosaminyltransferase [Pseudomonadota bacterium]
MSLGIVLLAHGDLARAGQVARHWASQDCPVMIHVDGSTPRTDFERFQDSLRCEALVRFSLRIRVAWGTWSMVAATQLATTRLLEHRPDVRHVFLVSGTCLPLRPAGDLRDYLDTWPGTDFIESLAVGETSWPVGGLEEERFTLRFPFDWRRTRRLFDGYTALQRRLGMRRTIPDDVEPHLGSQWWCLTRQTLEAILGASDRKAMDAYFRQVWIPDESYFQTLVRRYSGRIESRSLTLSKFDVQGRPHMFYDDHGDLLARSDCFVARKVWPGADGLYRRFLSPERVEPRRAEPNPGEVHRMFEVANAQRRQGRPGLLSMARFPAPGIDVPPTASRYNVVWGFDDLFDGFQSWLASMVGGRVHGHLYHPERAMFAGGATVVAGALSDAARLRDYRPGQFLANLVRAAGTERQTFFLGPGDCQAVVDTIVRDPNATVFVVSGAWTVPFHRSEAPFDALRAEAFRLQATEAAFLDQILSPSAKARVRRWTLAELAESPTSRLNAVLSTVAGRDVPPSEVLQMRDLTEMPAFLMKLRDAGVTIPGVGGLGHGIDGGRFDAAGDADRFTTRNL